MKRKAYYVQKPDGTLVTEDCGVAIPFENIKDARRKAKEVFGIIGYWNWFQGVFVPRKRA